MHSRNDIHVTGPMTGVIMFMRHERQTCNISPLLLFCMINIYFLSLFSL